MPAERDDLQRLRIREIAFGSTLQFKMIAIHDIFLIRVLDPPFQHVVARESTGRIGLLDRLEIIDTVVRRDVNGYTALGGGITGSVIDDGEVRIDLLDHGIGGRDVDVSRPLVIA